MSEKGFSGDGGTEPKTGDDGGVYDIENLKRNDIDGPDEDKRTEPGTGGNGEPGEGTVEKLKQKRARLKAIGIISLLLVGGVIIRPYVKGNPVETTTDADDKGGAGEDDKNAAEVNPVETTTDADDGQPETSKDDDADSEDESGDRTGEGGNRAGEDDKERVMEIFGDSVKLFDGYDKDYMSGKANNGRFCEDFEKLCEVLEPTADQLKREGIDVTSVHLAVLCETLNQPESMAAFIADMPDSEREKICDDFESNVKESEEYQHISISAQTAYGAYIENCANAIKDGEPSEIEWILEHFGHDTAKTFTASFVKSIINTKIEETVINGTVGNFWIGVTSTDSNNRACLNRSLMTTTTNEHDTPAYKMAFSDDGEIIIKGECGQPVSKIMHKFSKLSTYHRPETPTTSTPPTKTPDITPTPTPTPQPTPTPPTPTPNLTPKNPEAIEANMGVHDESTNDVDVRGATEQTEAPVFDHEVNVDNSDAAGAAAQQEADAAAEAAGETPTMSQEELASNFAEFLNNHQ